MVRNDSISVWCGPGFKAFGCILLHKNSTLKGLYDMLPVWNSLKLSTINMVDDNECCFLHTWGLNTGRSSVRYSRLIFTSDYQLCANLHKEKSLEMTSRWQSFAFAWRQITDWSMSLATMAKWPIGVCFHRIRAFKARELLNIRTSQFLHLNEIHATF